MQKMTLAVQLEALPPDQQHEGAAVELNAHGKVTSLEGDHAMVRIEDINGYATAKSDEKETPAEGDEALRRLAAAADDESWSD